MKKGGKGQGKGKRGKRNVLISRSQASNSKVKERPRARTLLAIWKHPRRDTDSHLRRTCTARVLEDQVVGQERLHDVEVTLRWEPMGTSASGALGLGGEKKAGEIRRRGGLKRGDAPWILPISLDHFSIQLREKYVRLQEGRDRWVSGCLYKGQRED